MPSCVIKSAHRQVLQLALAFILSFSFLPAGAQKIDSLTTIVNKHANDDTAKVTAIEVLVGELYNAGDYEKCISWCKQGVSFAQYDHKPISEGFFLHYLGKCYYDMSDFTQSLNYYGQAFIVRERIPDSLGMAKTLGNIGNVYTMISVYPKALDMQLKCVKICEKLGPRAIDVLKNTFSTIGVIYLNTRDEKKALEYHNKSLALEEKLNNELGIAQSYGNIGKVYLALRDTVTSIRFQEKSLTLAKKVEDTYTISNALTALGGIYQAKKEYEKALDFFMQSKAICEKDEDLTGVLNAELSIGSLYESIGKLAEAEKMSLECVKLARELGLPENEMDAYNNLRNVYDRMQKPLLAYHYFKRYVGLKDTILSDANQKDLVKHEMSFEFEKKEEAAKAEQDKKDAVAEAEAKRQRLITYGVSTGLLLVLVLVVVVYRNLQNNKKKNRIIEEQKNLVEHKNKEITDSITYAKRLQEAILPPFALVKKFLPQSFILYKPKDIVAGDFYWMETEGNTVWIAAADCTGHGVPGAMVSVVCSNAMNQAFKEFGLRDPARILDKTRDLVLGTFSKSDKDVKDGMDISLCVINLETLECKWAGANNPLWYVHNGELKEITAHKQPIGKTDDPKPFVSHTLQLTTSDSLFLFTDGYADQFGGPKGKKFKYKQMSELMLTNATKEPQSQKEILESSFDSWKGALEQVDDVCVIGIRI